MLYNWYNESISQGKVPRPDERTNTMSAQVTMKGAVVAVVQRGSRVEVWVASPTGDASDSFIYNIPCLTDEQAQAVAEMWKTAWGISL